MKGIILAGGTGSRLCPSTMAVSKQLLPIYDKPLIYYPLSVLLLAGIRDILLISTPVDIDRYERLLGDGTQLGIHIEYAVQEKARGLVDAFIVGEKFIGDDSVCLILGDNVFYGATLRQKLKSAIASIEQGGAAVFGYYMKNPRAFGVVELDKNNKAISIVEKPEHPRSNYIVPGIYFYDNSVVEMAKKVQPSARGEIEISTLNMMYLEKGMLNVSTIGRGVSWFDTGSPKGMYRASGFVKMVQELQGYYVACIEEVAWRMGFIDDEQLRVLGQNLSKSAYGEYILSLVEGSRTQEELEKEREFGGEEF